MLPLKEIKSKLTGMSDSMTYTATQGTNNTVNIGNLSRIRKAVTELIELQLFREETTYLVNSIIFTTGADSMIIQNSESGNIRNRIDAIRVGVVNLVHILDASIPEENPNSVNIKLPNNVKDFSTLAKLSFDIDKAFSIIHSLPELNGQVTINSVDNGSILLNVYLGTPAAVLLIAKLLKDAVAIRNEIIKGEHLKEQVRALKINNDKISLDEIETSLTEAQESILVELTDNIVNEYPNPDKEDKSDNYQLKIKNSISLFSELFKRGVIITPSISKSAEIPKEFPNKSEMLGLENKTKQIESPGKS